MRGYNNEERLMEDFGVAEELNKLHGDRGKKKGGIPWALKIMITQVLDVRKIMYSINECKLSAAGLGKSRQV